MRVLISGEEGIAASREGILWKGVWLLGEGEGQKL
jgi:hypothetical protein